MNSPPHSPTARRASLTTRLDNLNESNPPDQIHTLDLSHTVGLTQSMPASGPTTTATTATTTEATTLLSSHKISKIEGLAKHFNLVQLNLSGNAIKTVENLHHLRLLETLDLSRNSITNPGLQLGHLTTLKRLSLAGNFMQHVPKCLSQLSNLEVLDLSGNKLSLLRELRVLSPLENLHELSALGNRFCELPHYREYVVYTLRSMNSLDTRGVSNAERHASVSRFAAKDSSHEQLEESLRQSTVNANTSRTQHNQEHAKLAELLRTTQQLLEQRTSEWAYANERMAELEQDLAFHKIDQPSWVNVNAPISSALLTDGPTDDGTNNNNSQDPNQDPATVSLLSLLSPTFDWDTGKDSMSRNAANGGSNGSDGSEWVSPAQSPTRHMHMEMYEDVGHVGLMDGVQNNSDDRRDMRRVPSKKELEERAQGVSDARRQRDLLALQVGELESQEEGARHALNDAVRHLHKVDDEIAQLEKMSDRIQQEVERRGGVTGSVSASASVNASSNANENRQGITGTRRSESEDTEGGMSMKRKETAGERFGMSSRVQLDHDRQNLVNGLNEIDGLNKLLDALDLKAEATRDLLVCRTEALVLSDDRELEATKGAQRMEEQLVDVHQELTEAVRSLLSDVSLDPSMASFGEYGVSASSTAGEGSGLYDKGITALTRESQHLTELKDVVEQRLATCVNAVSDLEAAVLNQAQVVEEETDLVTAPLDGVDDDGAAPSPRKRARPDDEGGSDQQGDQQIDQPSRVDDILGKDFIQEMPLTFNELTPPTEDPRPTSPASAMRQTLFMLEESTQDRQENSTTTTTTSRLQYDVDPSASTMYDDSALPRIDGEGARHHHQRVVVRARKMIVKRRSLKDHVIVLEREHHQIHARFRMTENRWLRACLEITTAEARMRRIQFHALSKYFQKQQQHRVKQQQEEGEKQNVSSTIQRSAIAIATKKAPPPLVSLSLEKNNNGRGVSTPTAVPSRRTDKKSTMRRPRTASSARRRGVAWELHTDKEAGADKSTTSSTLPLGSGLVAGDLHSETGDAHLNGDMDNGMDADDDKTQFHFALRQLLRGMNNGRTLYGKSISTPDEFFDAVDMDDDGNITMEEFAVAMKRMDVELSCAQIFAMMRAMDVRNTNGITYFEIVNALRVEMRLLREEENKERDTRRYEDRERRRVELVRQRKREEEFQRDNAARQLRETQSINQVRRQKKSALKKAKKSMPPSMERALRKRLLRACDSVGGVSWRRVFQCHLDKVASLTLETFRSGMRRDGRLTIKVFDNPSVRDVFHSVDVERSGTIDHNQFVAWLDEGTKEKRAGFSRTNDGSNSTRKGATTTANDTKRRRKKEGTTTPNRVKKIPRREMSSRSLALSGGAAKDASMETSMDMSGAAVEEVFMIAVRSALQEAGKDNKRIELVIGSLQYMLDNGQEEKARMISGKAFGGNWPDNLLFPPDAAAREEEEEEEGEKESLSPSARSTTKKSLLLTTTTSFGGGRSLPWENPSTPTRRDEFGNYTTITKSRGSSARRSGLSTTSSIRRGTYFGAFPSEDGDTESFAREDDKDGAVVRPLGTSISSSASYASSASSEEKKDSAPTVFVTTSRRNTLFGRPSASAVINAKTSNGRRVFAKKNAELIAHEQRTQRLERERVEMELELSTNVEELNKSGEVLYDIGSVADPHFVENLGKSSNTHTTSSSPSPSPPRQQQQQQQRKHKGSVQKRNTRKSMHSKMSAGDDKNNPPPKVNLSIFGGSKFKPRSSHRKVQRFSSAVKKDMYMREKFSGQMASGVEQVLFK